MQTAYIVVGSNVGTEMPKIWPIFFVRVIRSPQPLPFDPALCGIVRHMPKLHFKPLNIARIQKLRKLQYNILVELAKKNTNNLKTLSIQ